MDARKRQYADQIMANDHDRFGVEIDYTILDYDRGSLIVEAVTDERHVNTIGTVSGGYLFTLCDKIGGMAVGTCGVAGPAFNGEIQFLHAVHPGQKLICEANVIRMASAHCVVDVVAENEEHTKTFCRGLFHYAKKIEIPVNTASKAVENIEQYSENMKQVSEQK